MENPVPYPFKHLARLGVRTVRCTNVLPEGLARMPLFQKDGVSILFVHIPKAGGTAIEEFFQGQGWTMHFFDNGLYQPSVNKFVWCPPQHFHAAILKAVFNLETFSYCFTTVRDPIERIKSEIRWQMWFEPNLDPERWVRQTLRVYPLNPFICDNHIRPQSDYLFEGLDVHHLEDGLESVIAELIKRFPDHFTASPAIPRAMVTRDNGPEIKLLSELIDILRIFYAADYHNFCYA